MRKILTIDGPSGVGKGTVAFRLAKEYGWQYLDSGALYRLAVLQLQDKELLEADIEQQITAIANMAIQFITQDEGISTFLNGKNVDKQLRTEITGKQASLLAAKPEIRATLLTLQREFAKNSPLIADGRDMGSVVFPEASLKIFLDADSKVRAQRRYKQLKAKGENVNLATLEKEIAERDERDRNRKTAPLIPASDAVVIDTTELSVDEVLQQIKNLFVAHFFNLNGS
ncbi:(d)CMP kinase [Suttonella ornithocola]|uniref:Cytidylate kinase n=1 Tax=Suttonella ornithocola TaxID=279832 RepID=A0A380MTT6_9GAMM|nr:(d)CMP kinase [Suttonella ornithocola]SUO94757.1 Cytidylate kinase [Suttonella ornithocola]